MYVSFYVYFQLSTRNVAFLCEFDFAMELSGKSIIITYLEKSDQFIGKVFVYDLWQSFYLD